ncbi:MAG TPA: MFS transporter [Anaerolineales bacterium]|nr:MFS transporter [Anaerolineales bacterium]
MTTKESFLVHRLRTRLRRASRSLLWLTPVFYLIEFFDELHYGLAGAALPAIRADLGLSYAQIGLLLGLPGLLNAFIEPGLMLLGDTPLRKRLVVGGGLAIVAALALTAGAHSLPPLLLATVIAYPASGAFVSLAQATLIDLHPNQENAKMARWTAAGSLGALAGPLALAGLFAAGVSWRWGYVALAGLAGALTLGTALQRFPRRAQTAPIGRETPGALWENLAAALRNRRLLRWIVLLQFADLLLDVFTGYAALYFSDVAGLNPAQTALTLSLMLAAGLAGDLALVPLLARFPGRRVVRVSAAISAALFASLLLAPWTGVKIALATLVNFSTLGWYAVLQGEAYAAAPGRSGAVLALSSLGGALGGALVWLVGWTAGLVGLPAALWLLLLGPLALLVGVDEGR